MKYSLTINDLSADQIKSILTILTIVPTVTTTAVPIVPAATTTAVPIVSAATTTTAVPIVPAATTTAVPIVPAADSTGVVWDERIHHASKTQTVKKVWKRRRNIQDFEFDKIVEELKAGNLTPSESIPASLIKNHDFKGLMQQLSDLFSSESINVDYPKTIVDRLNESFGVNLSTITDIADHMKMVEYAWKCLEVDGKAV